MAGATRSRLGWGFPLRKLERAHTAFLSIEADAGSLMFRSRGPSACRKDTPNIDHKSSMIQ
jgi:hypothetical protein